MVLPDLSSAGPRSAPPSLTTGGGAEIQAGTFTFMSAPRPDQPCGTSHRLDRISQHHQRRHDQRRHERGRRGTNDTVPLATGLAALERRVGADLDTLNLPAANWPATIRRNGDPVLDVVVVGAGMNGIAA